MTELTEEQFGIIKALCTNNIYVACIPDVFPDDPAAFHKNRDHHMEVFTNLAAHGFVENITAKFKETIEEIKKEHGAEIEAISGQHLMFRGFQAFCVTETAIKMFDAPEGLVN